jgi:hypothetical protein
MPAMKPGVSVAVITEIIDINTDVILLIAAIQRSDGVPMPFIAGS